MPRKIYTCPQCGITFTGDGKHKTRKYCSHACRNEARKRRITLTCKHCGLSFEVWPSQRGRLYCSKECHLGAGWVPTDETKHAIFICNWCGSAFEAWTYRQPRFCSAQCRSEFGARQPKPNARKPEMHITKVCAHCGKEYETTTHQVRLHGSRFCSRECTWAMMSIERRGEGNPMWNGGTLDPSAYGPNWNRQSRKAKQRDKHTCQACGYVSGGDVILDTHHIIPLREFDGNWKLANRLCNLITLCRYCHRGVELGKVECPRTPLNDRGLQALAVALGYTEQLSLRACSGT